MTDTRTAREQSILSLPKHSTVLVGILLLGKVFVREAKLVNKIGRHLLELIVGERLADAQQLGKVSRLAVWSEKY